MTYTDNRTADEPDRRLLLRAAIAVVLQRELSLSRRVYTWLLGIEETSDAQITHFKRYGLDMLSSTLQVCCGRVDCAVLMTGGHGTSRGGGLD